jgi:hypothetical protein
MTERVKQDWAHILNGKVSIGDRVAVAVGGRRSGAYMRIGTVLDIEKGRYGPRLKVHVEQGMTWSAEPYTKTYDYYQNMVKL